MEIPYKVRRLRKGTEQAWVYNSGGVVLLYDEGNAGAIQAADPFILQGFRGKADLVDPVLCDLAAKGLLVVYELYQDDEIMVEVAVDGPPLSTNEMGHAKYLGPRHTRLELPTGRLHIASHDTIQIGPNEPGGDPDAVVQVPPGPYAVNVSWLDREFKGEDGDEDEPKLPSEFIALTPSREPVSASAPMGILTSSHPRRVLARCPGQRPWLAAARTRQVVALEQGDQAPPLDAEQDGRLRLVPGAGREGGDDALALVTGVRRPRRCALRRP